MRLKRKVKKFLKDHSMVYILRGKHIETDDQEVKGIGPVNIKYIMEVFKRRLLKQYIGHSGYETVTEWQENSSIKKRTFLYEVTKTGTVGLEEKK